MINKPRFYLFLFTGLIVSCRRNTKETFDYLSLRIDTTKIYIFKWDTSLYTFPKFSKPLALTNDDIKLVDSLLIGSVDNFNKTNSKGLYESFNKQVSIDSFTIDLSKYKRQYFPYKDNNGQRVFQLVCFSQSFPKWRQEIYNRGVHGGITIFRLRINLSEKKADEFYIGGYG